MILGWRAWRLREGFLHSLTLPTVWKPHRWEPYRPIMAACNCGRSPGWWHRCGVNAYVALEDAIEGAAETQFVTDPLVVGSVRLGGLVVECERGYRAAEAYPDLLVGILRDGSLAPAPELIDVSKRYGVPFAHLLHTDALA